MKVINLRKIDKGGLIAEFELYVENIGLPLFVIPGWKILKKKSDGAFMIMAPRTLYQDWKTKEQKEGSIFKGRLNPKIEEIIFNLAMTEYGQPEAKQEMSDSSEDIPF
jgi:hypothetical protein